MDLSVLDCHYDGIGDAVLYAWLAHSARAAGVPCRVNLRRHTEIAWMFGITPDMATHEPGARYFEDGGGGSTQTADEITNADTIGTRFSAWAKHLGLGDIPPVRPPYIEHPVSAEWAETTWAERDQKTGSARRVLIFPETYWESRQWPIAYFKDLAVKLQDSGCNVVTMLPNAKHKDGFPFYAFGMSLFHGAAMMARADLVIGVDSGPAHIAGTIGTPTLAICGPTRPEIVFGHLPDVRGLTIERERVPCVGCHFQGAKGFRNACGTGCRALYLLEPETVFEEVAEELARREVAIA